MINPTLTMAFLVMKLSDENKFNNLMKKVNSILDDNYYYEIDRAEELVSCLAEDELFSRCAIIPLITSCGREELKNMIKDIE